MSQTFVTVIMFPLKPGWFHLSASFFPPSAVCFVSFVVSVVVSAESQRPSETDNGNFVVLPAVCFAQ